jgi:predicted small secreted protein
MSWSCGWLDDCDGRSAMNPVLVSKGLYCLKFKSTRGLLAGMACAAVVLFALATSSCATGRGLGQDIQRAGQNIEEAARR